MTLTQTNSFSNTKTNQLMLFKEIIALCCGNYTEHANRLCGENGETVILRYLLPRCKWSKQSMMSVPSKYDTQLATRQAFLQIILSSAQGDAALVAKQDSENCLHLALTGSDFCVFVCFLLRLKDALFPQGLLIFAVLTACVKCIFCWPSCHLDRGISKKWVQGTAGHIVVRVRPLSSVFRSRTHVLALRHGHNFLLPIHNV
jgi:hypothetical protein